MKRGDIVVHSHALHSDYVNMIIKRGATLPEIGGIYTVRHFIEFPDIAWYSGKPERIRLMEIVNKADTYIDHANNRIEVAFDINCFEVISEGPDEEDLIQSIENQQYE